MSSFIRRCAPLFVVCTLCLTVVALSQSESSVLPALARRAGYTDKSDGSDLSDSAAARHLLKAWYPDLKLTHGYDPSNTDESETYGELEPEGIEQVLDMVSELGAPLSGEDVFADMGSGIGQVALLVYLKSMAQLVVGIELQKMRHEMALAARENAFQALKDLEVNSAGRELRLLHGDIRDKALWKHWADASVIFTCSILFLDDLISDLREAFIANLKPGTIIFSLKGLGGNHKDLAPLSVFKVATSWAPARIFVYIRNLEPLVLKDLNIAIATSSSVSDDCIEWGKRNGAFQTSNHARRFCTAFAWKWGERAEYGHPRLDYDWVVPEL